MINGSGRQLLSLINDILDYSKVRPRRLGSSILAHFSKRVSSASEYSCPVECFPRQLSVAPNCAVLLLCSPFSLRNKLRGFTRLRLHLLQSFYLSSPSSLCFRSFSWPFSPSHSSVITWHKPTAVTVRTQNPFRPFLFPYTPHPSRSWTPARWTFRPASSTCGAASTSAWRCSSSSVRIRGWTCRTAWTRTYQSECPFCFEHSYCRKE
jgi:hypothetical protein